MNSERPKSSILERYHEAISALPPEEQYERMKKIKSPKTLRRLLSEHAPDLLVYRFAHRVKECLDLGFSDYELGRINFGLGNWMDAMRCYSRSFDEDARALVRCAEQIMSLEKPEGSDGKRMRSYPEAYIFASNAVAKMGDNEEYSEDEKSYAAYLAGLSLSYCIKEGIANDEAAAEARDRLLFRSAFISSDPETMSQIVEATVILFTEEDGYNEARRMLEPLAEKGNVIALQLLFSNSSREDRQDDHLRCLNLGIKHGWIYLYNDRGKFQIRLGQHEEAQKSFEQSIEVGNVYAYRNLSLLLAMEGYQDEAFEKLKEGVEKGAPISSYERASLLVLGDKIDEAEAFCLEHLKKDPRLHFLIQKIYRVKHDIDRVNHHLAAGAQCTNTTKITDRINRALRTGGDWRPWQGQLYDALFGYFTVERWITEYTDSWLFKHKMFD